MLITSHHARIFDGITHARMRALTEPAPRCDVSTHEADAVALWVHAPSGRVTSLCRAHMDRWLDDNSEPGDTEPPAVVLVPRRKS